MSRKFDDNEFDSLDRRHPSSRGRKHERRGQRHDMKHHMRDLKDMVNNGEDVETDDIMDTFENEE